MEWLKALGMVAPIIGGVGLLIHYFLRHIRSESTKRREHNHEVLTNCKECRREHNTVIANHMAHSTDAMLQVAKSLHSVAMATKDVAKAIEVHDIKMTGG